MPKVLSCGKKAKKDGLNFTTKEMQDKIIKNIKRLKEKKTVGQIRKMKRAALCKYFSKKEGLETLKFKKGVVRKAGALSKSKSRSAKKTSNIKKKPLKSIKKKKSRSKTKVTKKGKRSVSKSPKRSKSKSPKRMKRSGSKSPKRSKSKSPKKVKRSASKSVKKSKSKSKNSKIVEDYDHDDEDDE